MKDPAIEKLTNLFKKELEFLNDTWSKLNDEGVYVEVVAENNKLVIKQMRQYVEYLK